MSAFVQRVSTLSVLSGLVATALVTVNGAGAQAVSAAESTWTVRTAADAHVSAVKPGRNYGSSSVLQTAASPTSTAYVRFAVTGAAPGATAKLRLRALDAGSFVVRRTGNAWSESSITYRNAPPLGAVVGSSAAHAAGGWVEVDVTSAVTSNGTYDFAVTSPGPVRYGSREGGTAPELVLSSVTSSTPTPTPTPPPVVVAGPTGPADLRARTDLIYGSEIGAWRADGGTAVRASSGIPALLQAAGVPVIRFAMHDVFTDLQDPTGAPGTQTRANFDTALNGIRDTVKAEPFVKLLPIADDLIGTKNGAVFCPPKDRLDSNLEYYKQVVKQAGARVRLYESTNEMEYSLLPELGLHGGRHHRRQHAAR